MLNRSYCERPCDERLSLRTSRRASACLGTRYCCLWRSRRGTNDGGLTVDLRDLLPDGVDFFNDSARVSDDRGWRYVGRSRGGNWHIKQRPEFIECLNDPSVQDVDCGDIGFDSDVRQLAETGKRRVVDMLGGVGLLRNLVIERCACQDITGQPAAIVDRSLEQVGLTLRQCLQAVEHRLIRTGDGGSILAMRLAQCPDIEQWQRKPRFGQVCLGEGETGWKGKLTGWSVFMGTPFINGSE